MIRFLLEYAGSSIDSKSASAVLRRPSRGRYLFLWWTVSKRAKNWSFTSFDSNALDSLGVGLVP